MLISTIVTSDYESADYESIKVTQSYLRNGRSRREMQITWGRKEHPIHLWMPGALCAVTAPGEILVTVSVIHLDPLLLILATPHQQTCSSLVRE